MIWLLVTFGFCASLLAIHGLRELYESRQIKRVERYEHASVDGLLVKLWR